MRLSVELFVDRGTAEPKVGTEIDHPHPALEQWNRKLRSDPVRQRKKSNRRPRRHDGVQVRIDKGQARDRGRPAETGEDRDERAARLLAGSHRDQLHGRVHRKEPEQLLPRVSASANDRCFDPLRFHELTSMTQYSCESKQLVDAYPIF